MTLQETDCTTNPVNYIESLRVTYFHDIKNAFSNINIGELRRDHRRRNLSENENRYLEVINSIISKTQGPLEILKLMSGKMPSEDSQSLLENLLASMSEVILLEKSKDPKEMLEKLDKLYLNYSSLRKSLSE